MPDPPLSPCRTRVSRATSGGRDRGAKAGAGATALCRTPAVEWLYRMKGERR
jgi:hypothetical protein